MKTRTPMTTSLGRASRLELIAFGLLAFAAVWSAAALKSSTTAASPLLAIEPVAHASEPAPAPVLAATPETPPERVAADPAELIADPLDRTVRGDVRWVDGRRVRPVRTVWMTVTAYSPDHRSCGEFADGVTASGKSIWTNGMRLVAADKNRFKFGSLLSIPGYSGGDIVPVLDRGGAIKGDRLDVLYSTHEIARKWGVRRLPVVVWEYVDEAE